MANQNNNKYILFVSDFSDDVEEEELRQFFTKIGRIQSLKMQTSNETKKRMAVIIFNQYQIRFESNEQYKAKFKDDEIKILSFELQAY